MPSAGAGSGRGERARPLARAHVALLAWLGAAVLLSIACSAEPPDPAVDAAVSEPAEEPPESGVLRSYERTVVFAAMDTDSTLVVPWFFSVQDHGQRTDRSVQAWLSRNGSWEAFLSESWQGPASRAPWRLHPHGPLRFVVGLDDALEEVVFDQGPRQLELSFGGMLSEWTPSGDQVFRVHEGSVLLSDQRVEGVLLDINRSRPPGRVHGEWAFLTSGDSLFLVVDAMRPVDVPLGGASGWARLDFRNLQWADLVIEWTELRAFERARREVPVSWRIASPDGFVEGVLEVTTTEIEAGDGSGPLLPVYALFEVAGEMSVEGSSFPVRGLLRHVQQ